MTVIGRQLAIQPKFREAKLMIMCELEQNLMPHFSVIGFCPAYCNKKAPRLTEGL